MKQNNKVIITKPVCKPLTKLLVLNPIKLRELLFDEVFVARGHQTDNLQNIDFDFGYFKAIFLVKYHVKKFECG